MKKWQGFLLVSVPHTVACVLFHDSSRLFQMFAFSSPCLAEIYQHLCTLWSMHVAGFVLRSKYCWRRVEDAKGTRSMAAMGPQRSDSKVELIGRKIRKSLDFFGPFFYTPSASQIFSFPLLQIPQNFPLKSLKHLRHPAPRFFTDALPGLPCAGQRGHAVVTT